MDISFFDIITNSGAVGIFIWIIIFSMTPVAFLTGIISILNLIFQKKKKVPLAFKLLILFLLFAVFASVLGVLLFINDALWAIGNTEGAAKAVALAMSISNSLYLPSMTIVGAFSYMFFILISLLIMHFRNFDITKEEYQEELLDEKLNGEINE